MTVSCAHEAHAAILPAFPKRLLPLQECFCVLSLDSQNKPIGRPVMVAMGSISGVEVHPRDVFRQAVKRNARAVIVAHNHPSGDTSPSDEDRALTARLVSAGDLLGIPVLDHLVVTKDTFTSFADKGEL